MPTTGIDLPLADTEITNPKYQVPLELCQGQVFKGVKVDGVAKKCREFTSSGATEFAVTIDLDAVAAATNRAGTVTPPVFVVQFDKLVYVANETGQAASYGWPIAADTAFDLFTLDKLLNGEAAAEAAARTWYFVCPSGNANFAYYLRFN